VKGGFVNLYELFSQAKSGPLLILVKVVFLEHGNVHLFLRSFHTISAGLHGHCRDHRVHNTWNISYLSIFWKNLLTFDLCSKDFMISRVSSMWGEHSSAAAQPSLGSPMALICVGLILSCHFSTLVHSGHSFYTPTMPSPSLYKAATKLSDMLVKDCDGSDIPLVLFLGRHQIVKCFSLPWVYIFPNWPLFPDLI
jgi:hypothetical protein